MATKQSASIEVKQPTFKQKRKQDALEMAELIYDMFIKSELKRVRESDDK